MRPRKQRTPKETHRFELENTKTKGKHRYVLQKPKKTQKKSRFEAEKTT